MQRIVIDGGGLPTVIVAPIMINLLKFSRLNILTGTGTRAWTCTNLKRPAFWRGHKYGQHLYDVKYTPIDVIWYDTWYWNLSQDEINLTEHYLSFIKCFVSTSAEKIMLLYIAIISFISYDTDMISVRDWMAKPSMKMNDIVVSKNSFSLQIYCCVPGSRGLHWQWRGATGGRSHFIPVHPPIDLVLCWYLPMANELDNTAGVWQYMYVY